MRLRAVIIFSMLLLFIQAEPSAAALVKVKEIRSAVKSYIENNMPWPKDHVHIYFVPGTNDVNIPGEKIALDVRG